MATPPVGGQQAVDQVGALDFIAHLGHEAVGLAGLPQIVQVEPGGVADKGGVPQISKGDGFLAGQGVFVVEGDDIFFAAHQLEIDPVVRQGFVGQGQIDGPVQQVLGQLLGGAVQLPDADFRMGGGEGGQLIRQISPDVAAQREHILGSGVHALNILDAGVELGKGDVHAGEEHAAVVVELDLCPSGGRRGPRPAPPPVWRYFCSDWVGSHTAPPPPG